MDEVIKKTAVIGGGMAGLAATYRLAESGRPVVLYEATERVGGLLQTAEVGAARIDTAVQLLSSTYTRAFALAWDAGARDILIRASGRDALWRRNAAQEITYGSIPSMITSGALPTMLKLKLGTKYVPFLTMQASSLDANDPLATGGLRHDTESIAEWGDREMGREFVDLLTYPLLAAYYGSPPESTSAALYHALARVGMDVQVYAVRGGMSALAGKIASSVRDRGGVIRSGCSVATVQRRNDRWHIVTRDGEGADYDNIILATPPGEAARLVKGIAELRGVHEWLDASQTTRAATISITIAGAMRAQWFGVSFPRGDGPGERIVALTLQQNKPADLVPSGTSALNVFPALNAVSRVREMDATAALNFLRPSLERVFPGIGQRIAGVRVNAGDMQYRSMAPGFVRRIQELQAMTLPQGFALAGDYTTVPTVEGAVRSGEGAAALFSAQS